MSIEGCPHGPKSQWPAGGCPHCAAQEADKTPPADGIGARLAALLEEQAEITLEPLRVFVVESESLAAEYDVYDQWCVLAHSEQQAFELVRKDGTYTAAAEPLRVDSVVPVGPTVAYASFHPG